MSDAERYGHVQQIFEAVVDLPPERRAGRLEELCGGDRELRREVESLLEIAEHSDVLDFRLPDKDRFERILDQWERVPETIGPYRVVRVIGKGGMGVVYEAEQSHPRRRVAIKMLRPAAVTAETLKRFETEVETLGQLSHPGIAAVHDAGMAETAAGRQPYLVMEYVEGETLDQFVKIRRPSLRPLLAKFAEVCEAVQHAHLRGVLHRDLKPSNVVVDASGRPRILDFGLARALESTEGSDLTRSGRILGTLPYLGPEHFQLQESRALDVRSDVYALGVTLYELLAGKRPLSLTDCAHVEVIRRICEAEPVPLGKVDPNLRGDVEAVVAMAMAKDRERRYASAGELAEDLRRIVRHEPVRARASSRWYRARRFVRRHRAAVTAAATILALLGLAVHQARSTRDQAIARERETNAVLDRVVETERRTRLEAARALSDQQNLGAAEEILWDLFLTPRSAEEADDVLWVLRELYRRFPIRASWHVPHLDFVARILDDTEVVVAFSDGLCKEWDLDGQARAESRILESVGWGREVLGNHLVVLSDRETFQVWDRRTERLLRSEPLTGTFENFQEFESGFLHYFTEPENAPGIRCSVHLAPEFRAVPVPTALQNHFSACAAADGRFAAVDPSGRLLWQSEDSVRWSSDVLVGEVLTMTFTDDLQHVRVLTVDPDVFLRRNVVEFDLRTGTQRSIERIDVGCEEASFLAGGRILCAGPKYQDPVLWRLEPLLPTLRFAGVPHGREPLALGRFLAQRELPNGLRVWDLERALAPRVAERALPLGVESLAPMASSTVHSLALHGEVLAAGMGLDEPGGVNDLLVLRLDGSQKPTIRHHGHTRTVSSVAFAEEGRRVVSVGRDGCILQTEVPSGVVEERSEGTSICEWTMVQSGWCYAIQLDHTFTSWKEGDSPRNSSLQTSLRAESGVGPVAFSLDEAAQHLVVLDRLWGTLRSYRFRAPGTVDPEPIAASDPPGRPTGRCLARLPGDRFAAGYDDRAIRIHPIHEGRILEAQILWGHRAPVFAIAVHPHRPLLASGDGAGRVLLWNHETGQFLAELLPEAEQRGARGIYALAFPEDGGALLVGGQRQLLRIDLGAADPFVAGQLEYQLTAAERRGLEISPARIHELREWASAHPHAGPGNEGH